MLGLLRRRREVNTEHHVVLNITSTRPSDKDRAIRTAREVLKYERAGITITPSETINLAREYLKSLRIPESSS